MSWLELFQRLGRLTVSSSEDTKILPANIVVVAGRKENSSVFCRPTRATAKETQREEQRRRTQMEDKEKQHLQKVTEWAEGQLQILQKWFDNKTINEEEFKEQRKEILRYQLQGQLPAFGE